MIIRLITSMIQDDTKQQFNWIYLNTRMDNLCSLQGATIKKGYSDIIKELDKQSIEEQDNETAQETIDRTLALFKRG